MDNVRPQFKNIPRLILAGLALLIASGSVYGLWQVIQPTRTSQAQTIYQTSMVKTGDISISAYGTGTLVPGQTIFLSFSASGIIQDLNVQVGDRIKKGDTLAVLAGLDELKLDVGNKAVALQVAQKSLDDLFASSNQNLAQAFSDQAAAQAVYHNEEYNLRKKGDPRCETSMTENYQSEYINTQYNIKQWEKLLLKRNSFGSEFIKRTLDDLEYKSNLAWNSWKWCEVFSDQEILESQANLQLAEANKNAAEATYQDMKMNSGLDPLGTKIAEAEVENARLQFAAAQKTLKGATILAPIDGNVTVVNWNLGDLASTSTFITLADLDTPRFEVYVDESDAKIFSAGCPVVVSFDAIHGRTFPGIVKSVSPALVSVNNVNMVQGLIELDKNPPIPGKTLLIGQNMSMDVTCQQARNVLLVPNEAIYQSVGAPIVVYVLNQNNIPEKREVTVGIKTTTVTEIRSGLKEGEHVITSPIK